MDLMSMANPMNFMGAPGALSNSMGGGGPSFSGLGSMFGGITGQTQSDAIRAGRDAMMQYGQQGIGAINQGTNQGVGTLQGMYNQSAGGYQPFIQGGTQAFGQLGQNTMNGAYNMPQFSYNPQTSPGLQFQMQQGMGAIQNGAAARGGALGGNTLKSMMDYGQGLANTYQNQDLSRQLQVQQQNQGQLQQQYGNLSGIGQMGMNAQNQFGNLGLGYGSNISSMYGNQGRSLADMYGQMGNAQAAAGVGVANAQTQAMGNLMNLGGKLIGSGAQMAAM